MNPKLEKLIEMDESMLIDKQGIAELLGLKNVRCVDSVLRRHREDFPMLAVYHYGRGNRCQWYKSEIQDWITARKKSGQIPKKSE